LLLTSLHLKQRKNLTPRIQGAQNVKTTITKLPVFWIYENEHYLPDRRKCEYEDEYDRKQMEKLLDDEKVGDRLELR
jgi:hypothetical protein